MAIAWWLLRHRRQAEAYEQGYDISLPAAQTERFAYEFEQALRARGEAAREEFEKAEIIRNPKYRRR